MARDDVVLPSLGMSEEASGCERSDPADSRSPSGGGEKRNTAPPAIDEWGYAACLS